MSDAAAACKPEAPATTARLAPILDPATPAGAAVRTTIACVLAMATAFALHVEVPALAVVYVLARGSAGALTMLAGALAGSACALVLLALFDQSRVAFSVLLFVLTALATHAALGRRHPYAYVQGLLSCLVVVGQSLNTPDGAELHAFYDLANVLIAATAAFVAGAAQPVLVPAHLQDALATQLGACAALLRAGGDAAATMVLRLELSARRLHALRAAASGTRLAGASRRRALDAAVAHADALLRHVLALDAATRCRVLDEPVCAAADARALAARIERAAPLLRATRGPLPGDRQPELRAAAQLAGALLLPDHHEDPHDPGWASLLIARTRHVLARLVRWTPFLRPGRLPEAPPRDAAGAAPFVSRSDRFRVRHAVKSAASYLIVLWAWIAADWGAIVPALVVSVLVATLATPLGATLRKALLRVGGVLAGGAAGLLVAVVLLPWITTLPAICAVAGAILLFFLWIQQHSERLVFAALQAAIAFTLTLVHGSGPSPTWREPLDSLIALAFGIVVVVTVMHAVWPIDATTSARAVLSDLLRLDRDLLRALARRDAPAALVARSAAAQPARELAAGFTHEVELYGAQLGRPEGDLAGTLRAALELDAVLLLACVDPPSLPSPLPPDLETASADVHARLDAGCASVARALATPGLDPASDAAEQPLRALLADARELAREIAERAPGHLAHAEVLALAAMLLVDLRTHASVR